MRKDLIHKLDYNERKWLYKAIARMVIVDKEVVNQELEDLRESLKGLSASGTADDAKHVLSDPDFKLPLRKLGNVRFENACIIVFEIARLAAIDGKVAGEEKELIAEIMELIGFTKDAVPIVTSWMEELAQINHKETNLFSSLAKQHIQS